MIGQNVANFIVMPFSAGASPASVLELKTDFGPSNRFELKVDADIENTTNIVVQVQDSADGITYANLGSALTVRPGGTQMAVPSSKQFIKFLASGGPHGRLILSTDARTQHVSQLP
jgi:hypothetical protein